jgi:ABC-2 type transport system permease protein
VIEQLRTFSLLLGPKARGFLRLARTKEHRHPLRLLFFIGLGLVFAFGIYMGSAWFLRQCLQVELVGVLIPRKMMSLVLLILVSILLISTTISSFSIFYLSDDLVLLFSTPVPLGPLYYARFLEMTLHASWMVVFFGLPVFLAYGAVYSAPATFYLLVALLFPAFILIPSALGAIIAAVLTRLFSARRSRDLLIVMVLAGFVFLYLVLRAMQPEKLLEEESFGTLVEFLQMFSAPESRYLPTLWMTEALYPTLVPRPVSGALPALGVWTTASALVVISGWVGTALYKNAYARAQEGRLRWRMGAGKAADAARGRFMGGWLDRLGGLLGRLTGSLLVKDLRVFMRDTSQWLQLLLLGALAAVYILNFIYLKVANFSWFTLYTVNHVLMGLVISGIAVRFVFPAVSLEGRAFWIVRSAPIRVSAFLHSKLLIHFFPLATLAVFLSVLSCTVIGIPLVFVAISVALMLTMTLGVCALGVGIGAVHPRFTAENPAKIPTGIGGVVFMIASMSYVIVFLLASFYPTFVLYTVPLRPENPIHRPFWMFSSLVILILLGVGAAWAPMALGRRKLQKLEE